MLISCSSDDDGKILTTTDNDVQNLGDQDSEEMPDVDSEKPKKVNGCTGISAEFQGFRKNDKYTIYESLLNLGTEKDVVSLMGVGFRAKDYMGRKQPFEVDLSTKGHNDNFSTCTECVFLYTDPEHPEKNRYFFQKSGKLTVNRVNLLEIEGPSGKSVIFGPESDVRIENLVMQESILESGKTTPVENGECYEFEGAVSWKTICVPDCDGKICGSDGCGGSCGGCEDGLRCNADGDECVEKSCTGISIDSEGFKVNKNMEVIYEAAVNESFGNELKDILKVGIYVPDPGTYELGKKNLHECDNCVTFQIDYNFETERGTRIFYPAEGTLTITQDTTVSLEKLNLVEITIDEDGYSMPVQGGECVELETAKFEFKK